MRQRARERLPFEYAPRLEKRFKEIDEAARIAELAKQPAWIKILNKICPQWLAELVSCSFCFSHHTPWLLALGLYFPSLFVAEPWVFLLKMPIYALAAARLGTIINALVPDAAYEREGAGFLSTTYEEEPHVDESYGPISIKPTTSDPSSPASST